MVETDRAVCRLQRYVRGLLELANVAVDVLELVDQRLEELAAAAESRLRNAQGVGHGPRVPPNPSGQN